MVDTAIFDVDGTLVDTNYQHAMAWFRAFRRHDIIRPIWRIHRAIGMGGDMLVPEIAGKDVEEKLGETLRDAWVEEFDELIGEVQPFEGAHELLEEVKRRGFRLVLASSGQSQHVEQFIDLVDGRALADDWTTSEDAENSKPEPDLVQVAMAKVSGGTAVMIGDSTWDAVAAGKADVPTITVRTGGFSTEELREAGAIHVYDSLLELHQHLDETPLREPTG
jgi:HAD superfamily hydrolase (TIGR01549 family)